VGIKIVMVYVKVMFNLAAGGGFGSDDDDLNQEPRVDDESEVEMNKFRKTVDDIKSKIQSVDGKKDDFVRLSVSFLIIYLLYFV
jgi:hypothetical protein